MRSKAVFWGCNTEPVELCGVTITPKPSKPIQAGLFTGLKVVNYEINATVLLCNLCKKELIDPKEATSLRAHSCMQCLNYDLCDACYESEGHSHSMYSHYGPPIEKFVGKTVQDCLLYAFRAHAGRPMVGVYEDNAIKWFTYAEVHSKVMRFAAGLSTLNIAPGGFVATCAPNSVEYIIADYGSVLCGLTVVPVHVPFSPSEIDYIIQSIEASCVVCSASEIHKFLNNTFVRYIIQFEPPSATPPDVLQKASEKNVNILYYDDICMKGDVDTFVPIARQPADLFSVNFTSGSTGTPKGVMHTNNSVVPEISAEFERYYIGVCMAPYAHSARQNMMHIFFCGGRMGITSGNMETLLDEIQLIGPTSLNAVPRFWNMLYTQYKCEVALLEKADPEKAAIAPALISKKFKTRLGPNLRSLVSGGAPIGPTVLDFLTTCFGVDVSDGYASTEAGSVSSNNLIHEGVEVKLVSWGEYTTEDQPHPRGEICVKTNAMAVGYWKDEKTTSETFRDGWFHTGDIGEQEKDNRIRIIDRKKNLFKLAQGEFVAPESVENAMIASKFVKQIFVTGITTQDYLVAIVVPDQDAVLDWANHSQVDASNIDALYEDPALISAILSDFRTIGFKEQLPSFQIPRAIHIYNKIFTSENKLMTASNKINRTVLEKEFKGIVAEMYEKRKTENVNEAPERSDEHVLQEIISQYSPGAEAAEESIFSAGVDSLSAVQIVTAIKQAFNVDIKLDAIYRNPTKSGIMEAIRSAKAREKPPPSNTEKQFLDDLLKEASVMEDIFPEYDPDSELSSSPSNIFLTGATGFLGAFLLVELLRETTATIYCLVRSETEQSGQERLVSNMEYYMMQIDSFLARMVIVPGDLSKPLLGLETSRFEFLSKNIDSIYHCGARVNGIWPFEAHKLDNVHGTHQVVKLAAKGKRKQLHFISTLSVFPYSSGSEDSPLIKSTVSKLSGYGQSKWAAELICEDAREKGIPTSIYRFGTISGDSTTGRNHTSDYINRLISGIAFMGIYPVVDAKIEMIPVDYAARACIYISLKPENLGKNFHVVNPHPPSEFDELVSYISSNGYPELQSVNFFVWKAAIARNHKNPLFALLSYFHTDFPTATKIKCENTTAALGNAPFACPTNISEWIGLYLQAFVEDKIIKKPL